MWSRPTSLFHTCPSHARVWKPRPSLPISAECWLEAGGAVLIDADTKRAAFTDRLRWNQALSTRRRASRRSLSLALESTDLSTAGA